MDFPELSRTPSLSRWAESPTCDPTIRTRFENGCIATRARFTAIPRKWHVEYTGLTQEDIDKLIEFEMAVKIGADIFNWPNFQQNNVIYEVRLLGPIQCSICPWAVKKPNRWDVVFEVEEA